MMVQYDGTMEAGRWCDGAYDAKVRWCNLVRGLVSFGAVRGHHAVSVLWP